MFEQASSSCMKIHYLHSVLRNSHPVLLINRTYESSSQHNVTDQKKLGICAAINFGVHYNELITKYEVDKQILRRIRKDSPNVT